MDMKIYTLTDFFCAQSAGDVMRFNGDLMLNQPGCPAPGQMPAIEVVGDLDMSAMQNIAFASGTIIHGDVIAADTKNIVLADDMIIGGEIDVEGAENIAVPSRLRKLMTGEPKGALLFNMAGKSITAAQPAAQHIARRMIEPLARHVIGRIGPA